MHHHGAHQLLQLHALAEVADGAFMSVVRMLIAHRADPRREGLGSRASCEPRRPPGTRAAGPHAQQSTSRFTQRLSLVYS